MALELVRNKDHNTPYNTLLFMQTGEVFVSL
jgi:hypothetical protein